MRIKANTYCSFHNYFNLTPGVISCCARNFLCFFFFFKRPGSTDFGRRLGVITEALIPQIPWEGGSACALGLCSTAPSPHALASGAAQTKLWAFIQAGLCSLRGFGYMPSEKHAGFHYLILCSIWTPDFPASPLGSLGSPQSC